MSKPIKATNDFVVKFANVNGSGSASANELFARSILRMGVPVATRNFRQCFIKASASEVDGVMGYQAATVAPP